MPATLYLAFAVVATLLAALRIVAWTAAGLTLGVNRYRGESATRTSLAMLVGASLTMLIYAVLASAGMLLAAVVVDALVAAVAVSLRGGAAIRLLYETFRSLLPRSAGARAVFGVVVLLVWLVAIGPPRDGDVMHYHLAHIRQIIAARVWRQLPICSYGIPFGWSLTYLPFEWIGLPQGGQLLNAAAWLLTCSVCIQSVGALETGERERLRRTGRWMLLGATLLPAILKSATTAMADAFLILDVALVVALLLQWQIEDRGAAAALGFAAVVGWTTRYQAAAVSIAVALLVGFDVVRRRNARRVLPGVAFGTFGALIAALPFYLANAVTLGSAAWPFGASGFGGWGPPQSVAREAAERLAAVCTMAAYGQGPRLLLRSGIHLITDRSAFPIPLVLVVSCLVVLVIGTAGLRRAAGFSFLFLAVWAFAQPSLTPRFSIYLTSAAIICSVPIVAMLLETRIAALVRILGGVSLGGLGIAAMVYSWDYLRLAASGDVSRFHRATWYWPAYDWANRNTPSSARFVVALYGGDTYPLDRWNVSADPGSSAVVPWKSMAAECDLAAMLATARADYLFYGPDVWTGRPMDRHINEMINAATQMGTLDTVRVFNVPIVYGRMEGLERRTEVILYRFDRGAAASRCLPR